MKPNKSVNILYSEMIKDLPEADINFKGLKGWISQGKDHQIVFFDIEPIGEVSEHSHGAQWGMVIEGEMELTIGGIKKNIKKVIVISFLTTWCIQQYSSAERRSWIFSMIVTGIKSKKRFCKIE